MTKYTLYLCNKIHKLQATLPLDESKILFAAQYSQSYGRGSSSCGRGYMVDVEAQEYALTVTKNKSLVEKMFSVLLLRFVLGI